MSSGFIVYYFGDLAASIFLLDVFNTSKSFRAGLTSISSVCAVVGCLTFAYALLLIGKQSRSKTPGQKFSLVILTKAESLHITQRGYQKKIIEQASTQNLESQKSSS